MFNMFETVSLIVKNTNHNKQLIQIDMLKLANEFNILIKT